MSTPSDQLFDLLPVVYRLRDGNRGFPLRALLRVIAEQGGILETDMKQLYDNWFIETCSDWVVPYIGDLIGYESVHEAGDEGRGGTASARRRQRIVAPRREVANTIRSRRRKGTLAALEALVPETAGWPARIVERHRQVGWTQHLNFMQPRRGRVLDLRNADALDLLETPFDRAAHTLNVSQRNLSNVAVFVWRLGSYPVTWTQARCIDNRPNCYTFSILGNNSPLFTRPDRDGDADIATELDVPTPIRLRIFEVRGPDGRASANPAYYGPGKSVEIRVDHQGRCRTYRAEDVIPADLRDWHYQPPPGRVAVDPQLGRLAFHTEQAGEVWVRYHYGFSDSTGGGEYDRPVSQASGAAVFYVGSDDPNSCSQPDSGYVSGPHRSPLYGTVGEAVRAARGLPNVVIEITDSRLYEEQLRITVPADGTLQLRAANRKRPIIQIPDRVSSRDALRVDLGPGSRLVLDGLLISGRAVQFHGTGADDNRPDITIRHCTLVPGWSLDAHCQPSDAQEPSVELRDTCARVRVERSIIGSIQVTQNEVRTDPVTLCISDSIVDATSRQLDAIGGPDDCSFAFAVLRLERSTIIGHTHVHAIELAEDSIFDGGVGVARRQIGCIRFCYVPPRSRTPRRFECQPDGVIAAAHDDAERALEARRVEPRFNSTRYGSPVYCQLASATAVEISAGASDRSEMGVFHDLFQPQRAANLRVRLAEFSPASTVTGMVFAT